MTIQEFNAQYKKVTQSTVDAYMAKNRPQQATHADGHNKGIYDKKTGPAWSFQTLGTTWRVVLMNLLEVTE